MQTSSGSTPSNPQDLSLSPPDGGEGAPPLPVPAQSTVTVAVRALPDASTALTVIAFAPVASGMSAVHDVVPEAVPVLPVAAFDQVTCVTPTLSEALPPSAIGLEDAVAVGGGWVVIVTAGGVVSGGGSGVPPPEVIL